MWGSVFLMQEQNISGIRSIAYKLLGTTIRFLFYYHKNNKYLFFQSYELVRFG